MSVCHWNEPDDDEFTYDFFLGTYCLDGNSEVKKLSLSKFLKNEEP